ncbi:MAG: hypothetical protein JO323_22975 [Acidobacteriia bacterium]|nr:hypothetical protein [Terriglobia bacterium]
MSDARALPNLPQVTVYAMLSLVAESVMLYGHSVLGWPAVVVVAAHITVASVLITWSRRSTEAGGDCRLPLLLGISTAALGPVGPAGTLLVLALLRLWISKSPGFEEWYRSLFPDTADAENVKLVRQIADSAGRDSSSTTAFSDLLAFGSIQQKQDLIALISRNFRPAFGPVLKQALKDDESAIRVQAATAMNRLENSMLQKTLELTRSVRENPADPAALRALARHYDDCLYCGILDPKREQDLLSDAQAAYNNYLSSAPGDLDTQVATGRVLLRAGRVREASLCFARAIDPELTRPQSALWYLDSLFQLRNFGEIRSLARDWHARFELLTKYPAEAHEAVSLWAEANPCESPLPGHSI